MSLEEGDYGRLLPFRADLFPAFVEDQKTAADVIATALMAVCAGELPTRIIDLGCGTGEILDGVRAILANKTGTSPACIGVDCAGDEIDRASSDFSNCRFIRDRAEVFVERVRSEPEGPWGGAAILCVGHTLPHFRDILQVVDCITGLGPLCVVVDFHEQWDPVVKSLDDPAAPPIQALKHGRALPDHRRTEFALTTMRDPADVARVRRGIEMVGNGSLTPIGFWTSQLRRDSEWFRAALEERGYYPRADVRYRAGYGPMRGWVFRAGHPVDHLPPVR